MTDLASGPDTRPSDTDPAPPYHTTRLRSSNTVR